MKTNIRSITLFIVIFISLTFTLNVSSDEAVAGRDKLSQKWSLRIEPLW
jgi:hypothetical protein